MVLDFQTKTAKRRKAELIADYNRHIAAGTVEFAPDRTGKLGSYGAIAPARRRAAERVQRPDEDRVNCARVRRCHDRDYDADFRRVLKWEYEDASDVEVRTVRRT